MTSYRITVLLVSLLDSSHPLLAQKQKTDGESKKWSVDANLQIGSRSDISSLSRGETTYPYLSFKSTFASINVGRKFDLNEDYLLVPKFDLEMSNTISRVSLQSDSISMHNREFKPIVSLQLYRSINKNTSLVVDYTKCSSDLDELNNSFSAGIRLKF